MKSILIIFVTTFISASTFGKGTESSGGGPSVFCPSDASKTELYDLFEGRNRYNFAISRARSGTPEELIDAAFSKLAALDYGVAYEARKARAELNIAFLERGILLGVPSDLGNAQPALTPVGCQLMYAAFYEPSGALRISQTVFDQLSAVDRAALFVHEALYKLARFHTKQTDSTSTRLLVAYLFSDAISTSPSVTDALATFAPTGQLTPIIYVDPASPNLNFEVACKPFEGVIQWNGNAVQLALDAPIDPETFYRLPQESVSLLIEKQKSGSTNQAAQTVKLGSLPQIFVLQNSSMFYWGDCSGGGGHFILRSGTGLLFDEPAVRSPIEQRDLYFRVFPTPM